MTKIIDEFQIRQFKDDGIVFPIQVLTPEEAAYYRNASDALELQLGGKPKTIEVRQMHLHFGWAYALSTCPRILDAVEAILGPNLLIWATELFAKHPGDANVSIGWHRDRPYMGFDPATTLTAWVALSDSTRANGCMRAVPGASRFGGELRPTQAPTENVVDVILRRGEMSLHDVEILHGSAPNLSSDKRVGFAIRYVTPEARPGDGRPPALLARGYDDKGHFRIVDPPTETDSAKALAAMKGSATEHLDAMLANLKRVK